MVDVKYLARLMQMHLEPEEEEKLQQGFKDTLKTVKVFNELDTKNINPNFQVTGLSNVFRQDKIDKSRLLTQKQALSGAKKTHQGYFVVPRIINET